MLLSPNHITRENGTKTSMLQLNVLLFSMKLILGEWQMLILKKCETNPNWQEVNDRNSPVFFSRRVVILSNIKLRMTVRLIRQLYIDFCRKDITVQYVCYIHEPIVQVEIFKHHKMVNREQCHNLKTVRNRKWIIISFIVTVVWTPH